MHHKYDRTYDANISFNPLGKLVKLGELN